MNNNDLNMNLPEQRPENQNDTAIWERFLKGDKLAFEELMKTHFTALFHYGTKFSKEQEFIKDCIQDLFLQLWESRQNLAPVVVVKSYLMASLRRRIHRATLPIHFSEVLMESKDIFEIEFSIEEKFIQNESTLALTLKIKYAIEMLPKRQKEVIYLKFFQELEREQIAKIMDIAPQTVSNLLQMAVKQLKKRWITDLISSLTLVLMN